MEIIETYWFVIEIHCLLLNFHWKSLKYLDLSLKITEIYCFLMKLIVFIDLSVENHWTILTLHSNVLKCIDVYWVFIENQSLFIDFSLNIIEIDWCFIENHYFYWFSLKIIEIYWFVHWRSLIFIDVYYFCPLKFIVFIKFSLKIIEIYWSVIENNWNSSFFIDLSMVNHWNILIFH